MSNQNLLKLIGRNNRAIQTKEIFVLGTHSLNNIIQFFKKNGFGVITLQGIENPKNKIQKIEVKKLEIELQRLGLNYVKFQGRWMINFKEPINTREISFFILKPDLKTMVSLSKQFQQGTFIFSENGEHNLYYMDGYKVMLEKDEHLYGEIIEEAFLLKFKDFKFVFDTTIDFNFQFIDSRSLKSGDTVIIERSDINEDVHNVEIISIEDVRQNALINFTRENVYNTIEPKVFHFDELKYMIKLNLKNEPNGQFLMAQAV